MGKLKEKEYMDLSPEQKLLFKIVMGDDCHLSLRELITFISNEFISIDFNKFFTDNNSLKFLTEIFKPYWLGEAIPKLENIGGIHREKRVIGQAYYYLANEEHKFNGDRNNRILTYGFDEINGDKVTLYFNITNNDDFDFKFGLPLVIRKEYLEEYLKDLAEEKYKPNRISFHYLSVVLRMLSMIAYSPASIQYFLEHNLFHKDFTYKHKYFIDQLRMENRPFKNRSYMPFAYELTGSIKTGLNKHKFSTADVINFRSDLKLISGAYAEERGIYRDNLKLPLINKPYDNSIILDDIEEDILERLVPTFTKPRYKVIYKSKNFHTVNFIGNQHHSLKHPYLNQYDITRVRDKGFGLTEYTFRDSNMPKFNGTVQVYKVCKNVLLIKVKFSFYYGEILIAENAPLADINIYTGELYRENKLTIMDCIDDPEFLIYFINKASEIEKMFKPKRVYQVEPPVMFRVPLDLVSDNIIFS